MKRNAIIDPTKAWKLARRLIPTAIFSDCIGADPDAEGRLAMSCQSLFGMNPEKAHVNDATVMSFLMMDSLTRCYRPGVVLGNIAPRHKAHHHHNGIPFAWFKTTTGHLVVSTAQPEAFSAFKFQHLIKGGVKVGNTKTAVEAMVKAGFVNPIFVDSIIDSQFRSLDYQPILAAGILLDIKVPHDQVITFDEIPDLNGKVLFIDRFGNIKIAILESDVSGLKSGQCVRVTIGDKRRKLPFFRKLRDVPNGTAAVIVGSSGSHHQHMVEVVVNGGSARQKLAVQGHPSVEIEVS